MNLLQAGFTEGVETLENLGIGEGAAAERALRSGREDGSERRHPESGRGRRGRRVRFVDDV